MAALIIFYLLFPAVIIYLCLRFPLADKIGMIILCYASGLILGNINILPENAAGIQNTICEATVALSLPLLLFSMDFRLWLGLAGKTILSMGLAILSIILVATAGYLWIPGITQWQLVGMAVGVYTGGTPNLAAIKTALNIDPDLFLSFNAYDIIAGLLCMAFFLTIAQRVCLMFLHPFKQTMQTDAAGCDHDEGTHAFAGMLFLPNLKGQAAALLLSAAIVAVSAGISGLFPKDQATAVTILFITTLGIAASFVPKIRQIKKTFQLGMFLIMIFCLTVSSMASFGQLANLNIPMMCYLLVCVFGSMALHGLLCRFFNIDADTFIITSAAAICSPPFVPMVAAALKNRAVILSGLTTGIAGYAVGNYLGITIALIVKHFTV